MRKIHKEQTIQLAETLSEACKELMTVGSGSFVDACAEIQNFTVSIYDYVEQLKGNNSGILNLLKTMHEQLYKATQGDASPNDIYLMSKTIESEIKAIKPDIIEIAFFCYKASMSDCFESIYLAAKADPNCDAYFIPIPYYDRNPDGSFGQMHFEGIGRYGNQFELTDWQKYNIEERRPDVIFIMNPYDDQNYVTSVHPDYYSSRLKKLTYQLIYIEYGIPFWVYNDPAADKESIKNNALIFPGYINCNNYIAYSKEMADYLEIAFKFKLNASKSFIETDIKKNKIVPLGSPKFDKVLSCKREDYKLPKLWREKSSGKKVILYNTSLSEFLKSTGQQLERQGSFKVIDSEYFQKVLSILRVFYARDDVVIWWRPHPLFESTICSMRPEMIDLYHEIIAEFKNMKNGIFDNTDDIHRAIACSNAMISDESSLLYLYLATGKPFYIPTISKRLQAPKINTEEDYHSPINARLQNMRGNKGANVGNWNTCIWWDNFQEEDFMRNTKFDNYVSRFLDFVMYPEKYPEREEYKELQLQMFRDFVVNPDGTSGQKILNFVKTNAGL